VRFWDWGLPLANLWRRGLQRFETGSPEDSESTIIKESNGNIAGIGLSKLECLVDDSRRELGRGDDG
jgi:hypothetical protein